MRPSAPSWLRSRTRRSVLAASLAAVVAAGVVVPLALGGSPAPVAAREVLHVVPSGGAHGGPCSTAAPCTLDAALGHLNPSTVTQIQLNAGYYVGTLVIDASNSGVDIVGAGAGATFLEPVAATEEPVVVVEPSVSAVLADLTVTGGTGTNETYGAGGIDNAGSLTLENVTVSNNTVTQSTVGGGGIVNVPGASLTLQDSNVSANTAQGSYICAGGIANDGTLVLDSSTVSGNNCTQSGIYTAGGIVSGLDTSGNRQTASPVPSASLTVEGSTLANNELGQILSGYQQDAAGGVLNGGQLSVAQSTFSDNAAPDGYCPNDDGGAIANVAEAATTVSVTSSTFSGNAACGHGGAIDNGASGVLTVTSSTFTGNSAGYGGAIANAEDGGSAQLTVLGSTFTGNMAQAGGPAISNRSTSGGVDLAGNLLAGACNQGTTGWTDAGYNAATDASCLASPPAPGDVTSAAVADLGALASYGGPTETIEPSAGNPAIDLIPNPTTLSVGGTTVQLCPATDQRGTASSGACTAGAFQVVPTPVSPPPVVGAAGPTTGPTPPLFPPATTPTTTTPPPTVVPQPPLPAHLPASLLGTPTTGKVDASGTTTLTGHSGTATVSVSVPGGALPTGSILGLFPVTGPGSLAGAVPGGDAYLAAFGLTWITPTGATPAASRPVTVTITDPSIEPGDTIYLATAHGLEAAGTATTAGTVTITVVDDPGFVLASVPRLAVATSRATASAKIVAVTLTCASEVACRGVARASVARRQGGHVTHLVLAAHRFALPARATRRVALVITAAGRKVLGARRPHERFRMSLLTVLDTGARAVRGIVLP